MTAHHSLLPLSCFAAAGAWPAVFAAVSTAMMSPLERALGDAMCGGHLQTAPALLGHCAACWAGSALFAAAGLVAERAMRSAGLRSRPRLERQ